MLDLQAREAGREEVGRRTRALPRCIWAMARQSSTRPQLHLRLHRLTGLVLQLMASGSSK